MSETTIPNLRGAVLGLGMMGRHHARLLQASTRVTFAGAVDPGGDRFGAVPDRGQVFPTIEALLEAGPLDFAIVAVPTEFHANAVRELVAAGVSVLIEKPLAATLDEALQIVQMCRSSGVRGAVGHVERFNPALLELRRRANGGQLGSVFVVATERVGPFPDRIRDVGVVKDLATHDLDLVRWLGGAPINRVSAQTQNRAGREHEDLVLMTGQLDNGVSFTGMIDWLTPTKVRRTRVLGERGLLVADTLTADLFFWENGHVAVEWPTTQQFKGVSEGNMTRYALTRREPLLVELETFCDFVAGDESAGVVTLEEGVETVRYAEAVLRSARLGETVILQEAIA